MHADSELAGAFATEWLSHPSHRDDILKRLAEMKPLRAAYVATRMAGVMMALTRDNDAVYVFLYELRLGYEGPKDPRPPSVIFNPIDPED